MFHQTNDAEHFVSASELENDGYKLSGNIWSNRKRRYLPVYEAKMIQSYDHRAASVLVKDANWIRQGQTYETTIVEHQNPEFAVLPRFWVAENVVAAAVSNQNVPAYLAYKDITSPTNRRTMIAAFIPPSGVVNSAPLMFCGPSITTRSICCLLANLNSFAYDYVARQKVGGLHLNFFIVEQLPTFPPDSYSNQCPWDKMSLEEWISDRVLKLTCTSNEMKPLAAAAGFEPQLCKWNGEERAKIVAELDAAYFLLYGLERDDVDYMLSTFVASSQKGGLMLGGTQRERILQEYDRLRSSS